NPFSFYRRVAKRTKDAYELCLQRKKEKPERTVLLVPQGSQLRLSCATLCLKPKESARNIWRFSPQKLLHIQPLDVNNDRLHIASDLALEIKDATLDDNGTYYCIYNRRLMAMHTVDVVPNEPNRIILERKRLSGKSEAKVLKTWLLKENNLKLYTKWSEWSTCSRCDRTGLRKKYGICTLKKIYMSEKSKPVDIPLTLHDLNAYEMTEIPCRSSMLPDKIANLKFVKERASETLYGFCNVSCPNTGIEFVTDSSGKIIETVDKSKNLYSFKQKLPDLPGFVKRAYVYEEEATKIVLKCPG
ncbi:Ig-like V-type domain-containing protein FAM187A, partial [Leptotrombidium deliense]